MSRKPFLLAILLAASPLCLVAAVQAPGQSSAATLRDEIAGLRADLARLQAEVEAARRELGQAHGDARDARRQLEECLDLLQRGTEPRRHNCTPSRASLTYYQWLDRNGHPQRAATMLERAVAEHGDDPRRLMSVANELMHEDETAGEFDRAALALVQRALQRDGAPSPRALDVAALAHFLNGHVTDAVALERRAAEASRDSDFRARLRVYEAALRQAAPAVTAAMAEAAGGD